MAIHYCTSMPCTICGAGRVSKKYKQTLADGTVVEVEDVPINRKLILAGAMLPEEERRGLTPEELKEANKRAEIWFIELGGPARLRNAVLTCLVSLALLAYTIWLALYD